MVAWAGGGGGGGVGVTRGTRKWFLTGYAYRLMGSRKKKDVTDIRLVIHVLRPVNRCCHFNATDIKHYRWTEQRNPKLKKKKKKKNYEAPVLP